MTFPNDSRSWSVVLVVSGVGLVTLALFGGGAAPATEKQGSDLSVFMRKKLAASSEILEGLATEDAQLIRDGSVAMLDMSKAELWQVLLDEDYREFNREFRSSMRKLQQAAKDENFDRALLEWMDSVKGCVECHKYVRNQRPQENKS